MKTNKTERFTTALEAEPQGYRHGWRNLFQSGGASAGFTYRLYRLKPRASRSKGASRFEGASSKLRYTWGQLPVQDQFVCLSTIYVYSWKLVLFTHSDCVLLTPVSSNGFPWIYHSICWPRHIVSYSVVIFIVLLLCLLNHTDFYEWIKRKNLWSFMLNMHLAKA